MIGPVLERLHDVAPFTGAWIETGQLFARNFRYSVAPFTGAWIETTSLRRLWSRSVAPFTGAWIETCSAFGKA